MKPMYALMGVAALYAAATIGCSQGPEYSNIKALGPTLPRGAINAIVDARETVKGRDGVVEDRETTVDDFGGVRDQYPNIGNRATALLAASNTSAKDVMGIYDWVREQNPDYTHEQAAAGPPLAEVRIRAESVVDTL
ncbi:MAG: hypothetical protein QF915_00955 [Candidatus Woesearchaeota archaeon]|nr:hypothetical protein [Candidatus Woesearchaeota archaeon]MDP7458442.1 hypothetical protein [Candidatus Woesearchaeota archaeon]